MVPGRALPMVSLGSVLLNSQHIIRGRDKREERNNDGGNTDCLNESTTKAGMARNPA